LPPRRAAVAAVVARGRGAGQRARARRGRRPAAAADRAGDQHWREREPRLCAGAAGRARFTAAMPAPPPFKRVAVFCGSSPGTSPAYKAAAVALGTELAARGLGLVYGGGDGGLMGAIAHAAAAGGASVLGVMPDALQAREISGTTVGELRVVPDMHSRKRAMHDAADAFIALPGGYGTLEELAEMVTWQQLGLHTKPVGVLDVAGFYAPLLTFFDNAVAAGFVSPASRRIVVSADTPAALLDLLAVHVPPPPVVPPTGLPPVAIDVLN